MFEPLGEFVGEFMKEYLAGLICCDVVDNDKDGDGVVDSTDLSFNGGRLLGAACFALAGAAVGVFVL